VEFPGFFFPILGIAFPVHQGFGVKQAVNFILRQNLVEENFFAFGSFFLVARFSRQNPDIPGLEKNLKQKTQFSGQTLGYKVPASSVYRMLERHGWRKIVPRPSHPKADPQAQEAFKKTLRH